VNSSSSHTFWERYCLQVELSAASSGPDAGRDAHHRAEVWRLSIIDRVRQIDPLTKSARYNLPQDRCHLTSEEDSYGSEEGNQEEVCSKEIQL
jgi:hypothetical protein